MYTLAEVIQFHLAAVFAPAIGSGEYGFEATELLNRLLAASFGRTLRAHLEEPSEREVLDSLGTMRAVLTRCGCSAGATKVSAILERAQRLHEVAEQRSADAGASEARALPVNEFENLMLYVGVCDFEQRLKRCVGECHFQDGGIAIPRAQRWSAAWKARVKLAKTYFRDIVEARNALFHNAALPGAAQLRAVLKLMGQVLHWLDGAGGEDPPAARRTWGSCLPDWTHHATLQRGQQAAPAAAADATSSSTTPGVLVVRLRVSLALSPGGMRIPVPKHRVFVGRDREVQRVTDHLLADTRAWVLIRGEGGQGKDATAAAVVRSERVLRHPGIQLSAWLQATTDECFGRQLVDCFRVQRRAVLSGLHDQKECLHAITRWLRAHGGWLFVVEDATAQCQSFFDHVPLDAPHGRVLVTSKERLLAGPGPRTLPPDTLEVPLASLCTEDSLEIWRQMKVRWPGVLGTGVRLFH
jgi:hypothetical protein